VPTPRTQFLDLPPYDDGLNVSPPRRIAFIHRDGAAREGVPASVWLTGLKSAMISTKASALDQWAEARGRAFLRLDYSGHGQSAGRFEDGRVGAWAEEARVVLAHVLPPDVPRIVIGSSMGAQVALLLAQGGHAGALAGVVLIAPAWDATERLMWERFSPAIRQQILETGVYNRPSAYGDGDYALTRGLIEDGRRHLVGSQPFQLACPVHILHGAEDPDVPLAHGQALAGLMAHGDVTLEVIADGDHRLSRPQDIQRLLRAIETLPARKKR
jgi:pimeloyl-ACP methyl ester carboxylesterase